MAMRLVVWGRWAIAAAGVAFSGVAAASGDTFCQSAFSSLQNCQTTGNCSPASNYAGLLSYYQTNYPSCFGATGTSPQMAIVASSFTLLSAISQNTGSRLLASSQPTGVAASGTGLAAGSAAGAWNGWASYAGDSAGYRVSNVVDANAIGTPGGVAGSPFNIDNLSKTDNLIVGGDFRIAPSMVVGLSAAFDRSTGYVNPDARAAANKTNTSGNGQSLAAYVGWQLDKSWAIDATIGGGTGVTKSSPTTSADSTRRFAGVNINYANWIGNWQLGGKAGYQFGSEQFENMRNTATLPNTSFTAHLGQVKVGGEVGYWFANGVMPYVGAAYVNDVSRNRIRVAKLWDEDALVLSAGVTSSRPRTT